MRFSGTLAIICGLLSALDLHASEVAAAKTEAARFSPVEVYIDSPMPVAAWQFEVNARDGRMKLVGLEAGDSEQFRPAPFYDREALLGSETDKLLVADYSLADESLLPSGRFRIAILHLLLLPEADLDAVLVVATTREGTPISASLELVQSNEKSRKP